MDVGCLVAGEERDELGDLGRQAPTRWAGVPWWKTLSASAPVLTAAPTAPGALAELTTQQREIVVLASRGLTNQAQPGPVAAPTRS